MIHLILFFTALLVPAVLVLIFRKKMVDIGRNISNAKTMVSVLQPLILVVPFFLAIWFDKIDFSAKFGSNSSIAANGYKVVNTIDEVKENIGTKYVEEMSLIAGWVHASLDLRDDINYSEFFLIGLSTSSWLSLVILHWQFSFSIARNEDQYDNLELRNKIYLRILTFIKEVVNFKRKRILESKIEMVPVSHDHKDCFLMKTMGPNEQIEKMVDEALGLFRKPDKISQENYMRAALYIGEEKRLEPRYSIDSSGNINCVAAFENEYKARFEFSDKDRSLAVKLYLNDGLVEDFVLLKNEEELLASEVFRYFDDEQKKRIKSVLAFKVKVSNQPAQLCKDYGVLFLDSNVNDYFDDKDKHTVIALMPEFSIRVGLEIEKELYYSQILAKGAAV